MLRTVRGKTWWKFNLETCKERGFEVTQVPKIAGDWMRLLRFESKDGYIEKSLTRGGSSFLTGWYFINHKLEGNLSVFPSMLQSHRVLAALSKHLVLPESSGSPYLSQRILQRVSGKYTNGLLASVDFLNSPISSACWGNLCGPRPLLLSLPTHLYEWSAVILLIKLLFYLSEERDSYVILEQITWPPRSSVFPFVK